MLLQRAIIIPPFTVIYLYFDSRTVGKEEFLAVEEIVWNAAMAYLKSNDNVRNQSDFCDLFLIADQCYS